MLNFTVLLKKNCKICKIIRNELKSCYDAQFIKIVLNKNLQPICKMLIDYLIHKINKKLKKCPASILAVVTELGLSFFLIEVNKFFLNFCDILFGNVNSIRKKYFEKCVNLRLFYVIAFLFIFNSQKSIIRYTIKLCTFQIKTFFFLACR